MTSPSDSKYLAGSLYGRRKGHSLSPRRQDLMATLLAERQLDLGRPAPPNLSTAFPAGATSVTLEIGFGGGEHLAARAGEAPDQGFIGCEPFVNGMAKALALIAERGLANIRLHHGDAAEALDWLPPASLDHVYLLYPDPWPKRRHRKRRFVGPANLDRLARVLKPGGELRFASDIPGYVTWTLRHLRDHPAFEWTAETADDWRRPWADWPGTRYEKKAIAAGRVPAYLTFRRLATAG